MDEGISAEEEKMQNLLVKGDYEGVVRFLEGMNDPEIQKGLCYMALVLCGMDKIDEEYGSIETTRDEREFNMRRAGIGEGSPYTIFLEDEDECINGTENAVDFVPEDNPIKMYWKGLDNK
jgi:hypothetical protein